VQVIPEPTRASFRVDGVERLGYDFGLAATRPFFYPVVGPSGATLTRMGHPNPVGHEHHKSVWFGHQKVNGVNFWEEPRNTDTRLRHRRVTLYHDGPDFGGLAADLEWWSQGRALLRQSLIVALEPFENGEYAVDFQSRFEAVDGPVELGKTNFGFLGVRVAKTLSEQFGGGVLSNDSEAKGEAALFGKPSRWVDYSGPSRPDVVEGLCLMDHPDNPHHPSPWHVRRDGWMEPAFNLVEGYGVASGHPLDLRYRLLVHLGNPDFFALITAWRRFAATPPYAIRKGPGAVLASLAREPRRG
jgi:hypothetical protein